MSITNLDGLGRSLPVSMPDAGRGAAIPERWLDLPTPPLDLNGPTSFGQAAAGADWTAYSILDLLQKIVEVAPDRSAVDDGTRVLTRRQIWNGACRLTAEIAAKTPVGPIGILLPNEAGYAVAVLGCLAAGRACVVLDRHYPAVRNQAIIVNAGLAGIIVDPADLDDPALYPPDLPAVAVAAATEPEAALMAPPAAATLAPDDPALIVYTSGSTGEPKGIVLSQRGVLHRARELIDSLHMGPGDVSLPLASPCTVAGILQIFEGLLSGALLLKLDLQRVGLGVVLDTIDSKGVTLLFATPALLRVMVRLDGVRARLAGLKCVHPSGEVLLAADLDLLRECLPPDCRILVVYGLTEALAICQWFVPREHVTTGARVAVGYRLPAYDCAILDEDGFPVAAGGTGELVVRGRFMALGEWHGGRVVPGPFARDPAEPSLRVLRTGDLVRLRPDGAVIVVGRSDRQVQIHGMRVEPYEIENVLRRADGVLDAAVVARHDGEVPLLVAFVVLARAHSEDRVRGVWTHVQTALPAYMHPACITPIDALPLLPGHKVDAEALVALDTALAGRAAAGVGTGAPPLRAREIVAQAWHDLLGAASLAADAPFCEAGGDSLALLHLVFQIEASCGAILPFSSFNICMRPSDVTQAVDHALADRGLWPPGMAGRDPAPRAPIGRSPPLVLLSGGDRSPPIFIAHGLGGHVGELAELGRHLRSRHPLYALQAHGVGGGEPSDRIEDIAQYFSGAIEAIQPDGPCLLIGYSLGGLIMLEVAECLRQHGREVRLLAMLDTYPHPRFWPLRSWLSLLAQRSIRHGGDAARLPLREMIPRLGQLIGDFLEHLAFRLGLDRRPRDTAAATVKPALRRMRESLTLAEARYRPRRYRGEIAFFRAEFANDGPQDPRIVWGELADRVDVISVPGGHVSMLYTETLAARISDRLGQVLSEPR